MEGISSNFDVLKAKDELIVVLRSSNKVMAATNSYQGSHASWKVLDFFLENSRTWKVLEIKA